MTSSKIDQLRDTIRQALASGVKTETENIPETLQDREKITDALRQIEKENYREKIILAGFADHPVDGNRCADCMYYVVNGRWCALPEISLPAEPDWWCRLWRI